MQWLRWVVFCMLFLPILPQYGKWRLAEALRDYLKQRSELRRILARPVIARLQWLRRVLEQAARWAQEAQEEESILLGLKFFLSSSWRLWMNARLQGILI